MNMVVERKETNKEDEKKVEIAEAQIRYGLELKRIRESRKITQIKLHEISKVDKTVISELENGKYPPSFPTTGDLCRALDCSPHLLVAAYYGIPLPEFNVRDKEALENFVRLALEYTKKTVEPLPPLPTNRHPANEQTLIGKEEARVINKKRNQNKKQPAPKPDLEDNK
jgi:transcriptional regulator with XRE-family HTH domain